MSDPKRHRGEFVPCSECDRPQLCAVLQPKTQPCWKEPAPPGTAWRRLSEERPPDRVRVLFWAPLGFEIAYYDAVSECVTSGQPDSVPVPADRLAHRDVWWHPLPEPPETT